MRHYSNRVLTVRVFLLRAICAAAVLFVAATALPAQDDDRRVQFQEKARPSYAPSNVLPVRPQPRKTNRVSVTVREEGRRPAAPAPGPKNVFVRTSNLVVSSEPLANVVLKPSAPAGAKPLTRRASEKGVAEFENIRHGKYEIVASLEGFYTTEADIVVAQQKTIGVNLELEKVKYRLTIETPNVLEGEVRYAPARFLGNNADKTLRTIETGGYCIVKINGGRAVINDLEKGYYNLDIQPAAVEYERALTAISTDILEQSDNSASPPIYTVNLEKKISTQTFSGSAWSSDDWIVPAGWKLQGRTMKTNGIAGIALPRNEQYRYYQNFEMISDVRLNDGDTVGFVMRYVNSQNYYLVQITGAKAAEPYNVSGFIIRNGKSERIFTNPNPLPSAVAAKKTFRILIKGQDNVFRIFIVDSETGDEKPLGNIVDRDNVSSNLRKGAVGVQSPEKSDFEVGTFTVNCVSPCR